MQIQKKAARLPTTKRYSPAFTAWLIATCSLAPIAQAADNPGAHEHGQAQLQMAMENNKIDIIFTSPAYNLAGFEHQARTDDEVKRLADIQQWLETTPLINTAANACSIKVASVQLGDDEHDHHDEHQGEESRHRDYQVAQRLNCQGAITAATLTSPLPGRFPELEALTIEWAGPSGQGSTLMTPSTPTFTLSE